MWLFDIFNKKTKGCLHGKTKQQKIDFFVSLSKFAITDEQFFSEQYLDLLPHEQAEFDEWMLKDQLQKETIKSLLNIIGKITKK